MSPEKYKCMRMYEDNCVITAPSDDDGVPVNVKRVTLNLFSF